MTTLKHKTITTVGCAALALATFVGLPTSATAEGTDILHFTDIKFMTNNGVEPQADGVVMADQKEQGHANNQKLSIAVTGLIANNTYELVTVSGTDTNVIDLGPFTTDARGKAFIYYTSLGHGHGGGKHSTSLPDSLNPVSLVHEMDVIDTNMQPVLSADLSTPDKLQYLIKRDLSTNGVKASLMIQANNRNTHFRLFATGLETNSDYLLAFNDEVVQTSQSDAKGRLDIHSLVNTPPDILDVRSVALWDSSSNVILQTELP